MSNIDIRISSFRDELFNPLMMHFNVDTVSGSMQECKHNVAILHFDNNVVMLLFT